MLFHRSLQQTSVHSIQQFHRYHTPSLSSASLYQNYIYLLATSMRMVWYCCKCHFGPHDENLYVACIQCGARRCQFCPTEQVDADMALSGSEPVPPYPCGPDPPAPEVLEKGARLSNSKMDLLIPSAPLPLPSLSAMGRDSTQIKHHGLYHRGPSSALIGNPDMNGTYAAPADGHLYICCQCGDGPKIYEVQPQCVCCHHRACSHCTHVSH